MSLHHANRPFLEINWCTFSSLKERVLVLFSESANLTSMKAHSIKWALHIILGALAALRIS